MTQTIPSNSLFDTPAKIGLMAALSITGAALLAVAHPRIRNAFGNWLEGPGSASKAFGELGKWSALAIAPSVIGVEIADFVIYRRHQLKATERCNQLIATDSAKQQELEIIRGELNDLTQERDKLKAEVDEKASSVNELTRSVSQIQATLQQLGSPAKKK
jgi:hypothetical protein